jgi:ABC-type uncharacterized transport system substrate-binding protein
VGVTASARLLAAGATWRLTGNRAAGGALLTGVSAGGETERTIAAMQLVKAGNRSVPPVSDAILTGRAPAELVDVLASINTPAARAALNQVAETPTVPQPTRAAAAAALRTLDQI